MAHPTFALTAEERSALLDTAIRLINSSGRLSGKELNWSELAAESILDFFELDGAGTPTGIDVGRIARLIMIRTTPSYSATSISQQIASQILNELIRFTTRKEDAAEAAKTAESAQQPSDETHDFAVVHRSQFDAGVDPAVFVSEADALQWLASYRETSRYPDSYVIVTRPKTQPWTVLNYEG